MQPHKPEIKGENGSQQLLVVWTNTEKKEAKLWRIMIVRQRRLQA